jgi:hypothetical protein
VPVIQMSHFRGAQFLIAQSGRPFAIQIYDTEARPNCLARTPIWRLFFFARKAHTLFYEN